jgi:hypothetical protein
MKEQNNSCNKSWKLKRRIMEKIMSSMQEHWGIYRIN